MLLSCASTVTARLRRSPPLRTVRFAREAEFSQRRNALFTSRAVPDAGTGAIPDVLCQPSRGVRRGEMAAIVEFEDEDGRVVRYVRHGNGGGLVSPRARVHEGASVAPTAYVEAGAQVGDRSRIGAGSWLDHDVRVGQGVVVAGNVHLGPRSRAEDGSWIGTGARVGSDAVIGRGARVLPDAVVPDGAVVRRRAGAGRSEFEIAA